MKGSIKLGSRYSGYHQVILVALGVWTFGQELQVRHSMGRDEGRNGTVAVERSWLI